MVSPEKEELRFDTSVATSGDIACSSSSVPIVSAGMLPMRFRDCQGGCKWNPGSFAVERSSGSPD